jgi:hypothetical protein
MHASYGRRSNEWLACEETVDADFGQHMRALERASRKRTEGKLGRADQSDRSSQPVGPVSRVSLESVVLRDNYHTFVVKDGEVYK